MKDGGKPKDAESQEESENESKMSVKIKDENSSESCARKLQKILENFPSEFLRRPFLVFFFSFFLKKPE